MTTRCTKCGICLIWPRNICGMCRTPTSPEQRLRTAPQPLTARELDVLEADALKPGHGSKVYYREDVLRLLVTIRTMEKRKRAAQVGLFSE